MSTESSHRWRAVPGEEEENLREGHIHRCHNADLHGSQLICVIAE